MTSVLDAAGPHSGSFTLFVSVCAASPTGRVSRPDGLDAYERVPWNIFFNLISRSFH